MKNPIHAPSSVLMIEPIKFGFNEEAFETNKFQKRPENLTHADVQNQALEEFKAFVSQLKQLDVNVLVYQDNTSPHTPDSIFPNNWISTHDNGLLVTYPMQPSNRRLERRKDIVKDLINKFNYSSHLRLENFENSNPAKFLEGTGSMIFDHDNKVVYAALSPRTNVDVLNKLGQELGYKVISFTALGSEGELIYHTNVMLCIGETFAVIGDQTIKESDKESVISSLIEGGKELIKLTNDQVYNHFAGNMLQLRNNKNETILVMSKAAYDSLTKSQISALKKHNDHILYPSLSMIEKVGGGSARCMLAEVYIPSSN